MQDLILSAGYIGILAVIFAESGLLIGFFLPGDSLLFTVGALTAIGKLTMPLPILIILLFIAAVAGDSVGYAFGKRVGRTLFTREDSFLFKKKNVLRAQAFYEKNGPQTIILARFIPIVRTFAPIVAGIGEMNYRKFLTYNLIGGALWACGVTLAGYVLGGLIPADKIDVLLLPIIVVIVLISVLPAVVHVLRDPEMRADIRSAISRMLGRQPVAAAPEQIEADNAVQSE